MAPSIFGAQPPGLRKFKEEPLDGADDFHLRDHIGATVIVTVKGPKTVATKVYGDKTAIACDVVVVTGDAEGTAYRNVLIFNAAPVGQLEPLAGQTVVAKVVTYDTKSGGKAPKFDTPDDAGYSAAEAYLKANAA